MAATERHIRRRAEAAAPRQRVVGDPVPGAVIDFRSVTKKYPSGDIGLEDATFAIHPGEFVFLVGSTGSGKSTIMRLLIKEIEPTYGSIAVAGRDLSEITHRKIPYYRRNLGVVFQDFKLLPNRTVHDNVAYALQVTGGTRRQVREKVPDILRLTGLSLKLHNFPTSSPAVSSSASPWRARSSTTRRCCSPTSRPATSIPRRPSGSCSCSTGSTAPGRRSSWRRTTRRWSTACAGA